MINLHEMVLLKVKQDYADGKLENHVQNIVHNLNLDETNDIDEILYMIAEQRIDETR
jgi:TATA-box binding protein (TBP) (component of TFIID and TFIIIB)